MCKKLLFLDIDGVLNTTGKYFSKDLNPDCLKQLERIIRSTGAEIVLSSQWRCHKYLTPFLKELIGNMGGKIAGRTKQIDLYRRIDEIDDYLLNVKPPFRYAVLDDEKSYFYPADEKTEAPPSAYNIHDHLVIVGDKKAGLTEAEADEIIDILNNGNVCYGA